MLTVAGSDPSGGAGVQADLKTATALGVYAAAALTSLTAQNTTGVQGIHPVPADFVAAQIRSVTEDLDVRAVKTGMLGDAAVVTAVADTLAGLSVPLVLDPVTVATSGDVLVPDDAVATILDRLLPLASVVTPNLPEARLLTGLALPGEDPVAELAAAGRALRAAGATYALVKGGHLAGDRVIDVLVGPDGVETLEHDRVPGPNTHGTGCTLSSAIAARLAVGDDVPDAVRAAESFLQDALRGAVGREYGAGHGPVDHLVGLR